MSWRTLRMNEEENRETEGEKGPDRFGRKRETE